MDVSHRQDTRLQIGNHVREKARRGRLFLTDRRWLHKLEKLLTMWPSLAATKHTRPPLKKVPFRDPKADKAAASDMIQPQLPSTLFLRGSNGLRRGAPLPFYHSITALITII